MRDKLTQRGQQKEVHDKTARALQELHPQDRVRVQDYKTGLWSQGATVVNKVAPRSYEIMTDNGYILRRNRRVLRKDPGTITNPVTEVDPDLLEEQLQRELSMDLRREAIPPDVPVTNGSRAVPEQSARRSSRVVKPRDRLIETM